MVIQIIDPPTTTASHCLFDLTMEHVEPQDVIATQQLSTIASACTF
jgi:hypothetical protein